jgi:redox-sensitive bicupin YhaK (pirin superfamily)
MFGKERIKGIQLWVAMPPELELAEPQSQYLALPTSILPVPRGLSQANTTV